MNSWTLLRRSLRFHARAHFGVVLGAAIGSAALIGALIVGDSVRESLRQRAVSRLGGIYFAMNTGDRFFRQYLSDRLEADDIEGMERSEASIVQFRNIGFGRTTALQLAGTAARQDGRACANQVNVLGVDLVAWSQLAHGRHVSNSSQAASRTTEMLRVNSGLSPEAQARWAAGDLLLINQALAGQLEAREGEEVILRIRKPSALAQDVVISPREETSLALRLKVGPILSPDLLGDFGLSANQSAPANAFLPLDFLARKIEAEGRANLVLIGPILAKRGLGWWSHQRFKLASWLASHWSGSGQSSATGAHLEQVLTARDFYSLASSSNALSWLAGRLQHNWSLEDAQLSVHIVEQPPTTTSGEAGAGLVEISSPRVFLEPPIVAAALKPRTNLLNHHAGYASDTTNELVACQWVTNGFGVLTYLANLLRVGDRATPYSMITATGRPFVPADMRDDEILINQWLADDLQAKPGDKVEVAYYAVDSASHLVERTNSLTVRGVVPLEGIHADRTLMPEFPGVAKAESTQDWDTGFPLVYKIRAKDEAYWKQYRGTPKAFITLAAGQAMWASRFGALTAIRYELPPASSLSALREIVHRNLLANLHPAELGFRFQSVREQALRAADQSQDFGQLFIGFSLFLVVAALLLMALLFQFSLEQRRAEVGTLLALGWAAKRVRRFLLAEGVVLALLGGILGTAAGIGYAKSMLWALTTIWRSAVGTSALRFHATAGSLTIGLCASSVVAVLTIWLTLRKQARQPARELLSGEFTSQERSIRRSAGWIALTSGLAGAGIVIYALAKGDTSNAEAFFGAGALILLAGLASAASWLARLEAGANPSHVSLGTLAVRGCARRRKRSLATIALLACGCFVIVSIGVFRLDAGRDAARRSSGTGGFALVGQTTLPVVQDLNSQAGREFFGLNAKDMTGAAVVPFRVHNGDDASCLNLNRAQQPRLLGVNPDQLIGRFTFADVLKGFDRKQGWELLLHGGPPGPGVAALDEIPAIGDANSIQWALGKEVGDKIDYTDEYGRAFKLRLVGAVANSILQGSLIIDEDQFIKRFPGESGHRFFLMDVPSSTTGECAASLSRALQDVGLEVTPAVQRLNAFNAVQNTYLGTFQILGGLGLLLGSAGLGVVVLRNVLERRGELALLLAVGFRRPALQWLVLAEHGALLGLGLGLGLGAALIAVLPALLAPARQLPYGSLAVTLGAVMLNGVLWTWMATRLALRGDLLAALRNE